MDDPSNSQQGADPEKLQIDGTQFAFLAVKYDQEQNVPMAIFYYNEAAQALLSAALAGSQTPNIVNKANEYLLRAETLRRVAPAEPFHDPKKSQEKLDLDRAKFLVTQGFEEDELGNSQEAIDLYTEAVDLLIKQRKNSTDAQFKQNVTDLATRALERAEALKKTIETGKVPAPPSPRLAKSSKQEHTEVKPMPILGHGAFADDDQNTRKPSNITQQKEKPKVGFGGLINLGPEGYTKDEIATIRRTSFINGREYVPFMSVDMKERFAYPLNYEDKHGKLMLSPKQKQHFSKWVRPDDFIENPCLILAVSCFSIKQTIVSDCSFVASLAISAQYERRFKKKLITSIIYPQNKQGDPVYNPCGKYMIKFHINGVQRKVVIDDFLPMGRDGELLCSFSNNKSELWVSLLEKAYMKVMGGYDFPGSNSSIDLHALTGWIPERIALRQGSKDFDADKEFKRVFDRFHKGHCLITIATGELSDAEADRAGLVPTHAYAMLDIREEMGKRLFMLKNPWSHLRWKGRFSEKDIENWTPVMQKKLNYDPKAAQNFDNGVFWIDYESLLHFFDVMYLNWNPEIFKFTHCIHSTWAAKEGPKKDLYNISDNPQYRLEVRAEQPSAIWILLTRHITDKDDFADNKEFITLLVYKTGGKKVFYPYSPPPYKDGVRINTPHYLCKMVTEKGTTPFTLIVSQYEKNNTIHYSLRVYATCEFTLSRIVDPYNPKYEKRINGEWKGRTAGGCGNYQATHGFNPIYQIKIDNSATDNCIQIELLGPKQFSVGFEVTAVTTAVSTAPGNFRTLTSGDYRPGYCVLCLDRISGGVYNIKTSTFLPNQEGPFFLDISSSVPFTYARLQ